MLITSLAKEVMFLVALVCLFAVCGQHYSKTYERIGMKFYEGVPDSTMKNWLNFGGDLGILRWVNEQASTIMVVAYPDRGAGKLSKTFYLPPVFENGGRYCFGFRRRLRRLRGCFALYLGCY